MTYLPVISLNMPQKKIWKIPGYFSLRLNYQNSERSGERFYEEEADYSYGISSSKFIIKPSYRLNWLKIPWLTSVLNLESNYSFFSKRRDSETNEILEEPLSTNYHTASINLKGPALFRDFETKKGRYKHLIEPQLNFKYVTETLQPLLISG